jgi:hypothetical protein
MAMNLDQSADKITPSTGTLNVAGALLPTTALTVGGGGTGLTTLTAGYVPYGNGTGALSSSANLYFDGTNLSVTGSTTSTAFIPTGATPPTNGMYLAGTNSLGWATNSTLQMFLNSSGNLSINRAGTNGAKLQITVGDIVPATSGNMNNGVVYEAGGGSQAIGFGVSATNNYTWINSAYSNSAGTAVPISFQTAGAEKMRLHASGGVSIGNTTDPGAGNLSVTGTVRTQGYTVATLPAAGTLGRTAYVTDALAPVFLTAVTGGGAIKCPVFDNGTAWVAG